MIIHFSVHTTEKRSQLPFVSVCSECYETIKHSVVIALCASAINLPSTQASTILDGIKLNLFIQNAICSVVICVCMCVITNYHWHFKSLRTVSKNEYMLLSLTETSYTDHNDARTSIQLR